MRIFLELFIIFLFSFYIYADNDPCSSPEAKEFDFWIGDWKAEWKDTSGNILQGTNSIKSILGGCVIEENFNGEPGIQFKGKSFSVYNPSKKKWQQTWVDDAGGYIVLEGGFKNEQMILYAERIRENKKILLRMIFYNIKKNNFDWNWERSMDDGTSWENLWSIHYTRLK